MDCLAVRVILPGLTNSRRRVVAAARGVGSLTPRKSAQRERLCAMQAITVQALLVL